MRAIGLAAGLLLLLGACASDQSLSDRFAGAGRVRGDGEAVSVFGMASRVEALPLAIGHCARYGRAAQFAEHRADAYAFRCVKT